MAKKTISFVTTFLFIIGTISCNRNKKVLQEDFINLYPNDKVIKKQYFRYSTLNPFFPNDSVYTPITSRKENPDRAKTLIKSSYSYELNYFYKYVKNEMKGEYNSYIYSNNIPLFRFYMKIYKRREPQELGTKKEIENYFLKKGISYKFIETTEQGLLIYLLQRGRNINPAYCVINSQKERLKIYTTYNVKDTLMDLPSQIFRPFLGTDIEN